MTTVLTDDCDRDDKMEEEATPAPEEEGKEQADSLFKVGEMLRLREEYWEAELLWRDGLVPGALDRWLERKKQQQAAADDDKKKKKKKKKRKVVRGNLSEAYTQYIVKNPRLKRELSDEEMAELPEKFRQMYVINKMINAKYLVYHKAIVDQYKAFGFAYEEKEVTDDGDDDRKEVTDDDDEKEDVAVMKN